MRRKSVRSVGGLVLLGMLILAGSAAEAQQAAGLPFSYQNPIDFSYPYNDGARERPITELRDPAIIRVGEMYYLTYTVFPFTHSTSRDPAKPDYNSSPGIMLYSS